MSPMQSFLKQKKLQTEIQEKESLLRKYTQLARAHETGEVGKLRGLVGKWRGASQEVLYRLLKRGREQESGLTLDAVIRQLRVDPVLVGFEEESGDFKELDSG